ncbi:ArsR/SmtB family transcription factor [Bifidobacterium choloepi]|uniref:Helix-turn-helix transcriptional regulator n=1 Tax=Bifidobacterium choloepi TaxID=2614131 RepID=A0A6I5NHJ5_9BIFI|nr:helix-turn-helix domain-containing protein [Bifidobacterium choloepi]NEG69783.1 helix-turn-helix transcriptional regulator [Bifidobacterium choloepi]
MNTTTHDDNTNIDTNTIDEARVTPVAEQLRAMANPVRMRILGALRIDGVQTVGELSAKLGEAVGSVSYHLAQLADAGLVEKTTPRDGDKRKSWWKATHRRMLIGSPEQLDRERNADDSAVLMADESSVANTVLNQYRRSTALTYETTYERYLDHEGGLPQEWRDAGLSGDFVLDLTVDEAAELGTELLGVLDRWQRRTSGRAGGGGTADGVVAGNGAATDNTADGDGTDATADTAADSAADTEKVAVILQLFRWIP